MNPDPLVPKSPLLTSQLALNQWLCWNITAELIVAKSVSPRKFSNPSMHVHPPKRGWIVDTPRHFAFGGSPKQGMSVLPFIIQTHLHRESSGHTSKSHFPTWEILGETAISIIFQFLSWPTKSSHHMVGAQKMPNNQKNGSIQLFSSVLF